MTTEAHSALFLKMAVVDSIESSQPRFSWAIECGNTQPSEDTESIDVCPKRRNRWIMIVTMD